MKLAKFIYVKYLTSLLLSISVSFLIFYIFSLLGNLGENIVFSKILIVSFLNVLEIMTVIPSFLIFLSIILFLIILKSNNEILIIKEYFSPFKLLLIFFPIIFIFSIVEINKGKFSSLFTNIKNETLGFNKNLDMKVIISENLNDKSILIVKGIDLNKSEIDEIQRYKIEDDQILEGEFSDDLFLSNGKLIANNLIKYFNDEILKLDNPKIIISNFDRYDKEKFIYKSYKKDNEIKFIHLIEFAYFLIFFWCLFSIFLNREYVDKKKNIVIPFFISLILLLYSLIIGTNKMIEYSYTFSILTLLVFILIFIKYYKYE